MSKAFTEISAGLDDAIAHAKGKSTKIVEHKPEVINVKAIREGTGMSQQKFCTTFGISIGTLRHWEQGLRTPRGPARVLLKIAEHNPKAIIEAMQYKTINNTST
ncbi:MAG: helix-turn-helix domain-containing protein [Methylococcales bacterium]